MSEPSPLIDSREPRVLAAGLDHPEAVCWSPRDDLVLAGGEAGQLYELGLGGDGAHERTVVANGNLLGIALDGAGRTYVCDTGSGHVVRIDSDGDQRPHGPAMQYPNYAAFDSDGNLWVTDSGTWGNREGILLRIDPEGRGEPVAVGPFAFANGLAIVDRFAYLVASGDPALWRIDLAGEQAECILRLPRTVPDGVAVDAEGGIWISCFQPNRVYRLDPSGDLAIVLDDWSGEELLSPTNIAFAGPELRTLVLASLCGTTIKAVEVWIAGEPLAYPHVR